MTDVTLSSNYTYGDSTITVNDGSLLPSAPNSIVITNGRNQQIVIAYTSLSSNVLSGLSIVGGKNTNYPIGSTVVRSYMDYPTIPALSKEVVLLDEGGGGGGTTDYEELDNKPQINGVELVGNKSFTDIGIQAELDKKVSKVAGSVEFSIAVDTTTGELYYEV